MNIDCPLLCFTSASVEAETLNHLRLNKDTQFTLKLGQCQISKWWADANNTFYVTFVRVPGGRQGVLSEIKTLSATFSGPILVFDASISREHCCSAGIDVPRLCIVRETADIVRNMPGLTLQGDQRVCLRETLHNQQHRRQVLTAESQMRDVQRARQAYADRFAEAFSERRFIEPPPADVWGNDAGNPTTTVVLLFDTVESDGFDRDFALAQTLSMEHPQPSATSADANPRPRRRRRQVAPQAPQAPQWMDILKQAEDAQEGDCVCLTCVDKVASVCFVPCGHQVMCDACVRTMWMGEERARRCPMCSSVPTSIVRPVTTERKFTISSK